jgi:hypothetical protein
MVLCHLCRWTPLRAILVRGVCLLSLLSWEISKSSPQNELFTPMATCVLLEALLAPFLVHLPVACHAFPPSQLLMLHLHCHHMTHILGL